jgi:hypothetical protein
MPEPWRNATPMLAAGAMAEDLGQDAAQGRNYSADVFAVSPDDLVRQRCRISAAFRHESPDVTR